MVKQAPFTAQLIYADTKAKFQEHTAPNGQVYVEVEPDAEYFVRIRSERPGSVLCFIEVDGESLGYHDNLSNASGYRDRGLYSFDGVNQTMKALVFVKTPVQMQGDPANAPPYWTGEIKVSFYEGIRTEETYELQASSNTWNGGNVGHMIGNDPSKKKGLKSSKGEYQEVTQVSGGRCTHYDRGQLLDTIVLKYCSTIGLIHAGILPKPPAWELHRMMHPANTAPVDQATAGMSVDLTAS